MQLPYFFEESLTPDTTTFELSPETTRHVVQVLRMREGDPMLITNGKGLRAQVSLTSVSKKNVSATVLDFDIQQQPSEETAIAISLLKNETRFEWFLEKATEIGINKIIPLICKRTERRTLRTDRMRNILISAMIQSKQIFLPQLDNPTELNNFLASENYVQKYIAHCVSDETKVELASLQKSKKSKIILIGPEGDFTEDEIEKCLEKNFQPVSLGNNRLRTETAGVVAAVLLLY